MTRNFSRLPADEIALAVGENLTQVCDLLELTLDLLGEIGTREEAEGFSNYISATLVTLNDGIMQNIFRMQPSLKRIQKKAVEAEAKTKDPPKPFRVSLEDVDSLSFENRSSAVMLRQVFMSIVHLCGHACVLQELSGASESEMKLFKLRMAQILGGPIYEMMQDLSCAHPDLSILSWRPPGN